MTVIFCSLWGTLSHCPMQTSFKYGLQPLAHLHRLFPLPSPRLSCKRWSIFFSLHNERELVFSTSQLSHQARTEDLVVSLAEKPFVFWMYSGWLYVPVMQPQRKRECRHWTGRWNEKKEGRKEGGMPSVSRAEQSFHPSESMQSVGCFGSGAEVQNSEQGSRAGCHTVNE